MCTQINPLFADIMNGMAVCFVLLLLAILCVFCYGRIKHRLPKVTLTPEEQEQMEEATRQAIAQSHPWLASPMYPALSPLVVAEIEFILMKACGDDDDEEKVKV